MKTFPRVAVLLAALAAAALSCTSSVDPNKGQFSCEADADCGTGYSCRPQAAGGKGRCFLAGECADVELCNGKDDNCDGRIDESFPTQNQACQTSGLGACAAGVAACTGGQLGCQAVTSASAEVCDGVDNDCDGVVDQTFDLSRDDQNCGSCGLVCGTGTKCRSAVCAETLCSDGLDNDGDGKIDCLDSDCAGQSCDPADASVNCASPAGVGTGDAGQSDAGADDAGLPDAGAVDAGTSADFCFPRELDCANGLDDDGDGRVDCADSDCEAKTCITGAACTQLLCPGAG